MNELDIRAALSGCDCVAMIMTGKCEDCAACSGVSSTVCDTQTYAAAVKPDADDDIRQPALLLDFLNISSPTATMTLKRTMM